MTAITIDRALLEQALEAMDREIDTRRCKASTLRSMIALRAALMADLRAELAQEQAEPVQEPVGAVLVNRESREGVMFYSADMVPDPTTLKDRFELVKVYTAPPKIETTQEPVAYRHLHEDGWEYFDAPTGEDCAGCQALYTSPPKADPVQEPVAWLWKIKAVDDGPHTQQLYFFSGDDKPWSNGWTWTPLYTAPPKPVPLTEKEIDRITDQQWGAANGQTVLYAAFRTYARAVERALEEKNRGR